MVSTPRWGTGGVLSDLQLRVARIIAGLVEAEDFALAGGAALIVRGDVERATRDLDFFGTSADAVDHLVPAAESALQQAGFQVERLIDSPGFTRFVVANELDRKEVDLASDARLFPTEAGPGFELLSSEELAADKVLAVFGRAEARDYVDLMSIEPRFGLTRLFELAREKVASAQSYSSRCWIASHAFGGTNSPSTIFGSKSCSIGFRCGEWVHSN